MIAKNHSQLTDLELEDQFRTYKLKPSLFTHEAHLRLAYIHIKKYGLEQAEKNLAYQIKGYAKSLGVEEKFNLTVTLASVKTVNHFMKKSDTTDFFKFISAFPRLTTNFKDILSQHYGGDIFKNLEAKRTFLAPDLLPFD